MVSGNTEDLQELPQWLGESSADYAESTLGTGENWPNVCALFASLQFEIRKLVSLLRWHKDPLCLFMVFQIWWQRQVMENSFSSNWLSFEFFWPAIDFKDGLFFSLLSWVPPGRSVLLWIFTALRFIKDIKHLHLGLYWVPHLSIMKTRLQSLPANNLELGGAAPAGWTLRRAAWCRSTFHLALYDTDSRRGWLTSKPHGPSFLFFSSACTTSQQLCSTFLCGFVKIYAQVLRLALKALSWLKPSPQQCLYW